PPGLPTAASPRHLVHCCLSCCRPDPTLPSFPTRRSSDLYDAAGNAKWYIAPNCTGPAGTRGTCTGAVYEVNGPHFFGADFLPIKDRKSTRLNSSHVKISYAVFCLKKHSRPSAIPHRRQPG